MPSDLAPKPTSNATRLWAAVSDHLEAFARAWDQGPPDLAGFAPPDPPEVRRLTLTELIKFDMEQRIQRNIARPLEDYFQDFPELTAGGPPCDLLYEDFHLRKRAGETVWAAEYFRRFPDRASELNRLIGGTSSKRSTSVFATRAPDGVKPGDRLDEFDLLALLGEGQFARVYLARQWTMQRLVALKVSAHRGAEAQTLAQLDHPHIVRVYDQRVLEEKELQLVYMPYLPGGTLSEVLAHIRKVPAAERSGRTLLEAVDVSLVRRGEVPPAASPTRAVWVARSWPAAVGAIGMKLAQALDYAHRHEVLHRDIKPANILLTAEGEPLLADFNIGCCTKVEGAGPTAFFGGTLPYMAPEHIDAFNPEHDRSPESLDGRADVFGLAVTLWELLTGSNPFGIEYLRGSWPETLDALSAHRRTGPPPEALAAVNEADVPGLKEVLLHCLSPDPADRPATAGEMARELELCLKPATRALVRPPRRRWRKFILRYPMLSVFLAALIPNILTSAFQIFYNSSAIIAKWPVPSEVFNGVIQAVNGFFFPLGLLILGLMIRPIDVALRSKRFAEPVDLSALTHARLRSLWLGRITAGLCVACWLAAGVVWPTILSIIEEPPQSGSGLIVHFVGSFVVCGLMAATYPYVLVTFLSVRVIYPALLSKDGPGPADGPNLRKVGRILDRYRVLAAAIPLAAIGLVTGIGTDDAGAKLNLMLFGYAWEIAPSSLAIAILSFTGVAGTLMAFALEREIRADLAALAEVPGTS